DWFQRNIEDQLYGENPPTWEMFKQAMMDEFLSPSERQNRAFQFERLRQMYSMSVLEYAKEFIQLSKYAQNILPTEVARVERFRAGLIPPLYNALVATEFPTLFRIIDKAKMWEVKDKEMRAQRKFRNKRKNSERSDQNKSEGARSHMRQT